MVVVVFPAWAAAISRGSAPDTASEPSPNPSAFSARGIAIGRASAPATTPAETPATLAAPAATVPPTPAAPAATAPAALAAAPPALAAATDAPNKATALATICPVNAAASEAGTCAAMFATMSAVNGSIPSLTRLAAIAPLSPPKAAPIPVTSRVIEPPGPSRSSAPLPMPPILSMKPSSDLIPCGTSRLKSSNSFGSLCKILVTRISANFWICGVYALIVLANLSIYGASPLKSLVTAGRNAAPNCSLSSPAWIDTTLNDPSSVSA